MITVSLCMIVKDEEDNLAKCLNSISDLVDEIIIVDTGSTDSTCEIAEDFTNNIYYLEWKYDFSIARNYSFSKATKDYVFWLDADDVLLPEDRTKFKKLKSQLSTEIGVVAMKYNYSFDENEEVLLSFYRERLIRRDLDPKWYEPVHEYIDINEKIYKSDICITHTKGENNANRNINIYKRYMQMGNELSERGLMYYAMELQNINLTEEAIFYFEKFLTTKKTWTVDCEWASLQLSLCYQKTNKYESAIKTLVSCLEKCIPNAEIYCETGNCFMHLNDYDKAIFWFELALAIKKPDEDLNYRIKNYFDFIPNYQLSICYYSLGDIENAIFYNNEALKIKPTDENALKNSILFNKMKDRATD